MATPLVRVRAGGYRSDHGVVLEVAFLDEWRWELFYELPAVQAALDAAPDPVPIEEAFGPCWAEPGVYDDQPGPVPEPSPLDEPAASHAGPAVP